MKKGTFFTNLFVLISVGCMYFVVLYMGSMDISTYISIGTLTVITLILFRACFTGLSRITQITGCLKKVRKTILNLHVKDPEYVWDTLREDKFIFKNSILDGEFNNFKKEMNRLEDEGAIYCQPDVADYINDKSLFIGVKKRVLDSTSTFIVLVGCAGMLLSTAHTMNIFQHNMATNTVLQCVKPIILMLLFTLYLSGTYVYIYKNALNNMCNEHRLFIGDFYKYVVPCAKNDMANNIVYLQQIQMQNNEKLSENVVELLSDKINDNMVRQSEKFNELARQIECMTSSLNRFNEGIDSLTINIKDMMENDRIVSKEQIKVMKECFVASPVYKEAEVSVAKEDSNIDANIDDSQKDLNKSGDADKDLVEKTDADDDTDSAVVEKVDIDSAAAKEDEKEVKKTTRKRTTKKATTAKKTTTAKKATTTKKSTTTAKKTTTTKKATTTKKTASTTKKAGAKKADEDALAKVIAQANDIEDATPIETATNDVVTNDVAVNDAEISETAANDVVANDAVTSETAANDVVANDAVTSETAANDVVVNETMTNETETSETAANETVENDAEISETAARDAISDKEVAKTPVEEVKPAPVKKKRGRKSKAEKEAELRAALEIAKKEMAQREAEEKAKLQEEEKKAEEAKDEAAIEVEEIKDEAAKEIEETKDEASKEVEEIKDEASKEVEEVKEEVAKEVEETKDEASKEVEEVKEEVAKEVEETKDEALKEVEEAKDEALKEVEAEEIKDNKVIAFRKEEKPIEENTDANLEATQTIEVVEIEN